MFFVEFSILFKFRFNLFNFVYVIFFRLIQVLLFWLLRLLYFKFDHRRWLPSARVLDQTIEGSLARFQEMLRRVYLSKVLNKLMILSRCHFDKAYFCSSYPAFLSLYICSWWLVFVKFLEITMIKPHCLQLKLEVSLNHF